MENTSMIIELAVMGMLQCFIDKTEIENDDLKCYYKCQDTSKEFARTNKHYSCPNKLYVDREPIPWKDRNKTK